MKKKNKKILIVGGTGFIGYHLATKCLLKGWKVFSFSKNPPRKKRFLKKVRYLIGDISNKKNFKLLNKDFNYVVNLGGYVDHTNKTKTYNSHFKGCKSLGNFFLKKKIESFIQMGSSGEYGKAKSPQKESFKSRPLSIYAKSKFLASKYLLRLHKNEKFPVTILRLYQAYGPKQDTNRFIPIVIDACLKNKKFNCSDGKQLRDFIYVDDVVDAIIKSIKSKSSKGQIINIGSGKPQKIIQIINYIVKNLKGGQPILGVIKLRKDETYKIFPDIKKAKQFINWKPKVNFSKGLSKTIRHYEKLQ